MDTFTLNELTLIGRGANSEVYRLNRSYQVNATYSCDVVIKKGFNVLAERYNSAIKLLQKAGVMTLSFAIPCLVEGSEAVILPDMNTKNEVCVSPNTIRNGYSNSLAESFLQAHPIDDIANFNNLLSCLRDIVHCTNGSGIGLDMDMIFFSVEKNSQCPNVYCILVDIDAMLHDDSKRYQLFKYNIASAKEALTLFIQYFVSTEKKKNELIDKMNKYLE